MSSSGEVANNNKINGQTTSSRYPCQSCGKLFTSVQALGGHQNAHRRERFALKRRQIEMNRHLARQTHAPKLILPRLVIDSIMPGDSPQAGSGVEVVAGHGNVADFSADIIDDLDLTLRL